MKKNDYLSAVAENFGINASALRFWEKEGLICFERDKENNYRKPTLSAIADIWEILTLKSIGFSSKEIKSALRCEADGIYDILNDSEKRLRMEIEKLQNTLSRLEEKKAKLKIYAALKGKKPQIALKKELNAVPYDDTTQDIVQYLLQTENANSAYIKKGTLPVFSIFDTDAAFTEKFGRAPKKAECIYGLLRVSITDAEDNNAEEFFSAARRAGLSVSTVLGRYLFSAVEGKKRYDFFEGFAFTESRRTS